LIYFVISSDERGEKMNVDAVVCLLLAFLKIVSRQRKTNEK
jgi:hypothetical protein